MKSIKFSIYLILAAIMFAGCDSLFDEVQPTTSVSGEESLSSEEGVKAIRASMYSKLRSHFAYTTNYFIAPDAMADVLRGRPASTRFIGYNDASTNDGSTTHIQSLTGTYEVIQDANLIIGGIEDGVFEDPEVLERYQGEALALRAFTMHNLVRQMGYEPGNYDMGPEPNWDEGIVIRTEPVVDLEDADERPRSSVDEVYDQILSDLDAAKGLLQGINADNNRITEAFVDAVTARVHLYAGNYSDAAAAADEAIANYPGQLVSDADGLVQMFGRPDIGAGEHQEAIFHLIINPDTEASTGNDSFINNGPASYTATQWNSQLPTQFALDKYDEDDHRLGWYGECHNWRDPGDPPGGCDAVNDNGLQIEKFTGAKGNTVDDMPYFRLAEVYLIKAEAEAKASGNPGDGVSDLNTLREARGVDQVGAGDFGGIQDFEDFILDERIRELTAEGHRYYDLKRLERTITNPDGSTKIRSDNYRILAPFPVSWLDVNEQLVQNPGPGYPTGD